MELDTSLLNTQYYKVRIKGKWSNPGKGVALLLGVVAIGKGAFGSPSTTLTNFTYLHIINQSINIYIYIYIYMQEIFGIAWISQWVFCVPIF